MRKYVSKAHAVYIFSVYSQKTAGCRILEGHDSRVYNYLPKMTKPTDAHLLDQIRLRFWKSSYPPAMSHDTCGGHTIYGVGMGPLICRDCGFETHQCHRCLSFLNVMYCQVEVAASFRSLVQRSPTQCGVSECDNELSKMSRP